MMKALKIRLDEKTASTFSEKSQKKEMGTEEASR